jgi:hypothetical protein
VLHLGSQRVSRRQCRRAGHLDSPLLIHQAGPLGNLHRHRQEGRQVSPLVLHLVFLRLHPLYILRVDLQGLH